MNDLSLEGTLEESTVPGLILGILKEEGSAELRFGARDTLYFTDGRLISVSTSDPDLRLPEVLLRSGDLNLGRYLDAVPRIGVRNPGVALCDEGFIESGDLVSLVVVQVREILSSLFSRRGGDYTMTFVDHHPAGMIELELPSDRLILDAIGRIPHWSLITRGLGDLSRRIRQVGGQDSRLYDLDLTEDETEVLNLCEAPFTVQELCQLCYLPSFETCRALLGLMTVRLVEPVDGVAEVQEPALSRIVGVVQQFNHAFTAAYRVVHRRIGEEIKEFLDRLAAELPAEVASHFEAMDLSEGGRVDAAALEASLADVDKDQLETTTNGLLNELLYQWVLRVRQELGEQVEREVTQAIRVAPDAR